MKRSIAVCLPLLLTAAFTSSVRAATLYVAPTGSGSTGCARSAPCELNATANAAVAGDTVILMDGIYKTQLYLTR